MSALPQRGLSGLLQEPSVAARSACPAALGLSLAEPTAWDRGCLGAGPGADTGLSRGTPAAAGQ